MTPTKAETAITRATEAGDAGARLFLKPPLSGGKRTPQFRVTATDGGYFMEEAIAGGRFWMPRAWRLTVSEINADNIPDYVWADREKRASRQAKAAAVLHEHKLDLATPVSDYEANEDAELRDVADEMFSLRWLLVWPAEVVAEHIDAYTKQWTEA